MCCLGLSLNGECSSTSAIDILKTSSNKLDDWNGTSLISFMELDIANLSKCKSCSSIKNVLTHFPICWLEERPKPIADFFSYLCGMNAKDKHGPYYTVYQKVLNKFIVPDTPN